MTLVERIRAQREFVVEVEPGKRIVLRRPGEMYMGELQPSRGPRALLPAIAECVVRWEGITEADLLGAAVGSSDPAPFDGALCIEVLGDRIKWAAACLDALTTRVAEHLTSADASAKN